MKFFRFFFRLLPKLSDFINSDDFMVKKIIKDLNLINKGIISSEKMRNSGNYIYDYAHPFFGKDF